MYTSQVSHRSLFVYVSMMLLCVLAGVAPGMHAALGQQRSLAPQQQTQSRPLNLRITGEQPHPLAMVSGDFDEDGIADLAIGYGLSKGGSVLLLRGNLDAHAPQTQQSWQAAGRHLYSAPYLQSFKPVSVAVQPSLMVSADVNGDGHLDIVYATSGSSQLNVMFGDGKGNFLTPVTASVSGGLTALAAFRPGSPITGEAIVAGYQSGTSSKLSILSYSSTALVARATYPLPGPATAMTVANLDADLVPDTAIVAGGNLMILHGKTALSGRGSLTTVPVSDVESVTTGEFLFDRHVQLQLSVLTASGDVVILAHNGFDPRPYTPQQIAETRRQKSGRANTQSLAQQAGNNGDESWVAVETDSGAGVHDSGGRAPILLRSRTSGSGGDDLVVVNSSQQQSTVISHSLASAQNTMVAAPSHTTASNLTSSNVVAAVSTPVTPSASHGLVLLSSGNISPEVITLPSAGNTFFVNTFADNTGTTTDTSDGTRCTAGSGEICTLRDAVTFANNDAASNMTGAGNSDTIMVPAGTYNLTWQAGTTDANTNALTHLEILGPVTIIGSTSNGGTIINGANNDTVFTINPGSFGSFNPSGESFAFDTALENLVIENGKNTNNLNINSNANYVGGGINWDAFGTGNLTLTNTTVENNTVLWGPGGGIWAENSAGGGTGTLTINGSTISNNSTPELGGGIETASPPAAVSISNTTITGNKAQISVNPSDGDADGSGGGLYLEGRQSPPATPQSTLTGVTISSNVAANDNGGGIATFTGILLSGSTISDNSTGGAGGGIWSNPAGDGSQTTITSSNFLSNTATGTATSLAAGTGGAIAMGLETQAEGNILQVSLSRIVGNTASAGGSGIANGVSGDGAGDAIATENWWGCNSGPATASDGCDQALLVDSSGTLTTAPFAMLSFSSDVTTIPPGGSMNLTVSLNTDSNNNTITGAFPAVATLYPYTFNVIGVTASPELTTGIFNTSGVGTATLTPTTSGSGTVTVTFDNQTDTINFTSQAATATSLSISAIPSPTFLYGQPSGFTAQLTPNNATGVTTSNFQVMVDGSPSLGGVSFGLTLIGNNDYQIFGPFNLLPAGTHTLAVTFLGTTNFAASKTSLPLSVLAGTVSIGSVITPINPLQGQGGSAAVTIAGVGSGAVPTGTVTYAFDGGAGTAIPLVGGAATIPIPTTLSSGSHSLAVTYSGDANYAVASTSVSLTVFGSSQTTIASLTATTATIDVFGFGFTAPSGQLAFADTTAGNPVAATVTLNTATAAPSLLPQVTTSTGVNSLPDWTELDDVNGDGVLDLITSVFGTDSINVQLGNGNGTFGAATSILIVPGFGPAEVHAVSLRGNGTLDLIIGSFNTNQIAVLLGNGNGTFQPPTLYTVGTAGNTPTSLTTGDFNNDGNLDVAVANTGNDTVSILLGNGSGALTPLGAPISVGRDPEAIRSGDFNSDGFADLAVANYQAGTVTILLNNKNETFTASTISVGAGPQALAITGTGTNLLLAVANYLNNTVSVLPSNNNGTFGAQKLVSVGNGPDDLNFADFNGDGIPDIAVANFTSGTVSLVLGNSSGSYTALGQFPVGNNPYSAAVGDLNRDGTPDLVVSNCFSDNTGVLLSGTQISVPYSGLGLVPGDALHATYTPDGNSKYGASTSPGVTAP
jgi:trimeric autotransporter adhesin